MNTDELLALCQGADEEMVVKTVKRSGVGALTDEGRRILRRVQARTPKQNARLRGYNRVYTARKRRVQSGAWPEDAPTASECVRLGVLDKAHQYSTRDYVAAVESYLHPPAVRVRETTHIASNPTHDKRKAIAMVLLQIAIKLLEQ